MLWKHVERHHDPNKNLHQMMDSVLEACSRPVAEIAASACPLCDEWDKQVRIEAESKGQIIPEGNAVMMPLEQFKRHLAGHQEELALFATTSEHQEGLRRENGR